MKKILDLTIEEQLELLGKKKMKLKRQILNKLENLKHGKIEPEKVYRQLHFLYKALEIIALEEAFCKTLEIQRHSVASLTL